MAKRWGYPGKTFTAADNPRLPYPVRVLPDATVYAEFKTGARRLDALITRSGLAISTLAEVPLLITRGGVLLVGDEIGKGRQDDSPTVEEIVPEWTSFARRMIERSALLE
jgi:hypothetical protein